MSVESLSTTMEAGVVEGMGSPLSMQRTELIQQAASSAPIVELESGNIKTGVSDAIENLDRETGDMFPDKENIAEVVTEKDNNSGKPKEVKELSKEDDSSKLIFGMKPLTFGVVVLALGVGGYLAYKKFKK